MTSGRGQRSGDIQTGAALAGALLPAGASVDAAPKAAPPRLEHRLLSGANRATSSNGLALCSGHHFRRGQQRAVTQGTRAPAEHTSPASRPRALPIEVVTQGIKTSGRPHFRRHPLVIRRPDQYPHSAIEQVITKVFLLSGSSSSQIQWGFESHQRHDLGGTDRFGQPMMLRNPTHSRWPDPEQTGQ